MKCLIYLVTTYFCLKGYVTVDVSQEFHTLLDTHYLKNEEDYVCTHDADLFGENDSEEKAIRIIRQCFVKLFKSNFFYCEFDELIVTNGEEFKCDERPINLEKQLHLDDRDILANSTFLSIIAGQDAKLENGFNQSVYFGGIQEIRPKYFICVLDAFYNEFAVYSLLTLECHKQVEVMISFGEHFLLNNDTFSVLEFRIIVPIMALSVCCISIVLVLYLFKKKLRSTYFGKCVIVYALMSILSQLTFISIPIIVEVFAEAAGILLFCHMTLQMASHFIINKLCYQSYSGMK